MDILHKVLDVFVMLVEWVATTTLELISPYEVEVASCLILVTFIFSLVYNFSSGSNRS